MSFPSFLFPSTSLFVLLNKDTLSDFCDSSILALATGWWQCQVTITCKDFTVVGSLAKHRMNSDAQQSWQGTLPYTVPVGQIFLKDGLPQPGFELWSHH